MKFNNSAVLCCGLASAVDALMAVKVMVYDRKEITLSQLKEELENNWEGYELLRAKVLSLKSFGENQVRHFFLDFLSHI